MTRALVVLALYLIASAAWIYGALNSPDGLNRVDDNTPMFGLSIAFLGGVHAACGYLLGRWWAVLLPAVLIVLAIPAGDFPASRPEYPIWFGLAMLAPVLLVPAALGVLARKLVLRGAGDDARVPART
jgi:hypothetical protein